MRFLARVLAASLFITLVAGVGLAVPAEAAARPTAPRAVKVAALNTAVKLTWSPPARSSGSRVDAYSVQQRNSGTTKWVNVKYTTGGVRSATITRLQNGALYYFRILARNRSGWSSPSAAVAVRPRTVPTAPRSPEADTYDRALGVYWTVPFSTGGATVDHYRVEISTDAATWTTPKTVKVRPTSAAPAMFTGLAPGTRYWFRVRAHNAAGYSAPSGAGPYTARAAPGPVENLAAEPGDTVVDLSWTAPEFDPEQPAAEPPASSYQVEQSTNGTTWTVLGTTTTTSYQAVGLVNGTSHHFRVRAAATGVRGFGPGLVVVSDPPVGAPSEPQNPALEWDEDADAHLLSWSAPASNGGVAITRYDVGHTPAGSGEPTTGVDVGLVTSVEAPDATTDEYYIRACNAHDCGDWSSVGPVPGGVGALAGDPLHGTSGYVVTLTWTAPTNGAVAPASLYTVQRSTDGTTFSALGTSATTTYEDTTAVASTVYTYRVVAVGADGRSAPVEVPVTTGPPQALHAPDGPLSVDEGATTTFEVTLAARPAVDTVVTVTSDDPAAVAPTEATVTVLAGQTTATVTVAGIDDDDLADGTAILTVTLGALSDTVVVDVVDDDTQAIVVPPTVQAVADGPGVPVVVGLAHAPTGPVTVSLVSDATNKAIVSVPEVVLTPENWDDGVSVLVSGVSPGSATIAVTAPGLPPRSIEVTVQAP